MSEGQASTAGLIDSLWAQVMAGGPFVLFASGALLLLALFVFHRAATSLERSRSERALASRALDEITRVLMSQPTSEGNKVGVSPARVNLSGPVQRTVRPTRSPAPPPRQMTVAKQSPITPLAQRLKSKSGH